MRFTAKEGLNKIVSFSLLHPNIDLHSMFSELEKKGLGWRAKHKSNAVPATKGGQQCQGVADCVGLFHR